MVKGLSTDPISVTRDLLDLATELLGTPARIIDIVVINTEMIRGKILDQDLRKRLLAASKKLTSSSKYSNVYINRDLTRTQRLELSEWRGKNRRPMDLYIPPHRPARRDSPPASGAKTEPLAIRQNRHLAGHSPISRPALLSAPESADSSAPSVPSVSGPQSSRSQSEAQHTNYPRYPDTVAGANREPACEVSNRNRRHVPESDRRLRSTSA